MKLCRWLLVGAALTLAGGANGGPVTPARLWQNSQVTTAKTLPQTPPMAPATPPSPPAPVGRAPADVDINTLQPLNLPPASRQKMRQCGEEWRALKMAGKSSGMVWRSFAQKCLVR